MKPGIDIAPMTGGQEDIDALAEILVEVVANGGSVSFMHPLSPERAGRFWRDSLAAAERGDRVVLGARSAGRLDGTVTLHSVVALSVRDSPPDLYGGISSFRPGLRFRFTDSS